MATLSSIKRLNALVEANIFLTSGKLDYSRTIEAIARLAQAVEAYQDDSENIWFIEGVYSTSPADILAGAFWHLYEWSAGEQCQSYRALCAVGRIFSPGCSGGPEPDSLEDEVYAELANMAERHYK